MGLTQPWPLTPSPTLTLTLTQAFSLTPTLTPRYKLWAYLSLDTVGFSSDGWYREHLLQHHMYTNTPWDNHFLGTDPFLVVDPTVPRAWWQRSITPFINPLLLTFGLYANYTAHLIETFAGHESWRPTKLLLPLQARTAPQHSPPQRCTPSATALRPLLPPVTHAPHPFHTPSAPATAADRADATSLGLEGRAARVHRQLCAGHLVLQPGADEPQWCPHLALTHRPRTPHPHPTLTPTSPPPQLTSHSPPHPPRPPLQP